MQVVSLVTKETGYLTLEAPPNSPVIIQKLVQTCLQRSPEKVAITVGFFLSVQRPEFSEILHMIESTSAKDWEYLI